MGKGEEGGQIRYVEPSILTGAMPFRRFPLIDLLHARHGTMRCFAFNRRIGA